MERKSGLHKKISSIFDGVPLPDDHKPSNDSNREQSFDNDDKRQEPELNQSPRVNESPDGQQSDDNGELSSYSSLHYALASGPDDAKKTVNQPKFKKIPPESVSDNEDGINFKQNQDSEEKDRLDISELGNDSELNGIHEDINLIESNSDSLKIKLKTMLFGDPEAEVTAKQKMMTVMIPVLAITLVIVLTKVLFPAGAGPTIIKAQGSEKKVSRIIDKVEWQPVEYLPEHMRDPMKMGSRSSIGAEKDKNELFLSGITHSESETSKSYAIIDGQLVTEGQMIDGIKIIKINRHSVSFEKDGKKWEQILAQE